MSISVQSSHDRCEPYSNKKIVDYLIDKVGLKESEARKIARAVKRKVYNNFEDIITSSEIREEVNAQLRSRGFTDEAREHERVGVPVNELKELIRGHNSDNANLTRNPETVHKFGGDRVFKELALMCLPRDIAKSHNRGNLHIHDLEYLPARPINCCDGSVKVLIKKDGAFLYKTFEELYEEGIDHIKVYTYNHNTQKGEFKPVNALIKNPSEPLYKVSMTRGRSIIVNKDHEFFKYINKSGNNKAKISRNSIKLRDSLVDQVIGEVKCAETELRNVDYFDKLVGFFLGDGTIEDGDVSENSGQVRFYLQKEDKISFLFEILEKENIPFRINDVKEYTVITIIDKKINKWFKEIWLNNKKLPDNYITEESVLGIMAGLISSDGYLTINKASKKPLLEFKTINPHIKDIFEICCFIAGFPLVSQIQKRDGNQKNIFNCIPNVYSKISLLKSLNLRKRQSVVLEGFNDENILVYSKIRIKNIEYVKDSPTYTFNVQDNHNYLAGEGLILNKNCLQHDLREFIKNGLKVDGTGEHTSIAGPPRQIGTLMNHMGEIMLAGQQNCSGGQGMSLWNVFAAPFIQGVDYNTVIQNIQMLVFNLNMAYSNRGGQVPFTSLNTEFTVPKFLEDELAYGPGGERVGVYGDYEEEVRILNRAFIEVMMEGDYIGKPHLFPNSIWMLRKEMMKDEFEEDLLKVHELSAKYSTPYFGNCLPGWTGGHSNIMGCRTRLNTNWTGDWDTDTLRTGNLAYVTLNLPRIAYKTEMGNDSFYEELDRVLGLAEEMLLIRREHALKCLGKNKLLPFLTQKTKEGEQYYRIQNATLSFGFVGMDEMLRAINITDGIVNKEGQKIAKEVLRHINNYAKNLIEETGYRWTILQTPGETTAHRFAMLDKQYYPNEAIYKGGVKNHKLRDFDNKKGIYMVGEEGTEYYTNSTHIPVDESRYLIPQKIKIESQFHPLTAGGHIFHGFIGEAYPNPEAMMSLTRKTAKTDLGFWAYTSAFSYCFACNNFMRGMQYQCNRCGSIDDIEHYSRITGYMQQVGDKKDSHGGWNAGKRQELKDRYQHEV